MKSIIIVAAIFLLSFALPPKGIYTIKIKDIDGSVTELAKYHGRKMVFIILSGSEPDSVLNDLASFCSSYKGSATMIGILSMEDGYTEANKTSIKQRFKSKIPWLILTEGMYTRKTSGSQSELMQWFTHTDQNQHFGYDITGTKWKFFVDEGGQLYAALGPYTRLSSPIVQRVMSKPAKPMPTPPAPKAPAPTAPAPHKKN